MFHDSAKGMIDCFCGMLVAIVSNIVTHLCLCPVVEFFQSPNSDWMYNDDSPKQCSFQLDEIWIFAFGTQLHVGSCFPKRIEKVPPALAQHLAKSEFTRHVFCLLVMGLSVLALFLQHSGHTTKHSCTDMYCPEQLTCWMKVVLFTGQNMM